MWTFLEVWRFLNFFENFRSLEPLWNTGQKNFFLKKSPQNTFKTRLDTFGNDLGQIRNIEIFFRFLSRFRSLKLPWNTGKKCFWKKLPQNKFKTRLDTLGNDFGHFWNFEIFLMFLKIYRRLDPPWNTGQKIIRKICPKTRSKHVWIFLGTILGIFGILKKKFWKFSKTRPSMESWASNFPKNCPKHVQNTFGHFWNAFGQIRNIEIFSVFFEI